MSQEQEESKSSDDGSKMPLGRFVKIQVFKNGIAEAMRLNEKAFIFRIVENVDLKVVLLVEVDPKTKFKVWSVDTEWWHVKLEGNLITKEVDHVLKAWGGVINFNIETRVITLIPKEEAESGDVKA